MILTIMLSDESFRERVMDLVKELYPALEVKGHPDSMDVVIADGNQLSLQNIWATYRLSETPETALRELVRHHFGQLLSKEVPSVEDLGFEDVRERLYPQIMPVEYQESAPLPLISFPLSSEVNVGLVADFPETYMYLRELELERWEIPRETLYEVAQDNLEKQSEAVEMQMAGEGQDTFIAVAKGDGYDAARILVPRFQEFLAEHLGESFRFAIPNRDFLICWRLDCGEVFHRQISSQVGADSDERPYPLSSSIFVRNSEGNIHEQPRATPD